MQSAIKPKGASLLGRVALGIFSFGLLSIGLISIGGFALGLLALSAVAVGGFSIGAVALGIVATGGIAIGIYALGGVAIAKDVAVGGCASAHVAIGRTVRGMYVLRHRGEKLVCKWDVFAYGGAAVHSDRTPNHWVVSFRMANCDFRGLKNTCGKKSLPQVLFL